MVDLGTLYHHTTRLQLPRPSHSSRLDKRTDINRVLVQRQGVAVLLMGPQEAGRSDGDSLLGGEEVLHPHAHNRSLSRKCISNSAGGVPPSYQEGEDSIADEAEVKCQRPPLLLVLVYLHNSGRVFCCLIFGLYHVSPAPVYSGTRNSVVVMAVLQRVLAAGFIRSVAPDHYFSNFHQTESSCAAGLGNAQWQSPIKSRVGHAVGTILLVIYNKDLMRLLHAT